MKKCLHFVIVIAILFVASSSSWAATITGNVPDGKVGKYYRATFSLTGYTSSNISWSISSTPSGLNFSSSGSSATLSGSPNYSGYHNITVYAGGTSASFSFTISESSGGGEGGASGGDTYDEELRIGDEGLMNDHNAATGNSCPEKLLGKYWTLGAYGGTPPYSWSVVQGDLPLGTTLACANSESGLVIPNNYSGKYAMLSGVLAAAGTYSFTLTVTDSAGQSATKDFSINVKGGDIDDIEIDGGFIDAIANMWNRFRGYADNSVWVSRGGRAPFTWSCIGGQLPDGLTLSTKSDRAYLSGTPTTAGFYSFVLKVTDADGRTAKKAFSMKCDDGGNLASYGSDTDNEVIPEISGSFVSGTVGEAYTDSLTVSNGTAPFAWSVSSGELPKGLSIASTSGRNVYISGTPESKGFYNFVLKVVDAKGVSNAKTLVIKITEDANSTHGNVVPTNTPEFKIANLMLEGQIGVNFYAILPEISNVTYSPENCWTEFNIRGDTSNAPQPLDYKFTRVENGVKYYGFRCYINSAQMADTITATLHYGNGLTITKDYSAKQYLDKALGMSTFTQIVHNLMAAIRNYGHYVQPMLAKANGWTIGDKYLLMEAHSELTDEDISSARDAVKSFALTKNLKGKGIASLTYNLFLDSETTIKIYIIPAQGYSVAAYLDGGTANMAVKNGDNYCVQIANIYAEELGTMHTVKIVTDDESTVMVSALSYAHTIFNADVEYIGKVDIATMRKAVTALYHYYRDAKAYFDSK